MAGNQISPQSGAGTQADTYAWSWILYHLIEAEEDEKIKDFFQIGYFKKKHEKGFPVNEIHTDFSRALSFFVNKKDTGGVFDIFVPFSQLKGKIELFKYESFLIWYGAVLTLNDDNAQIRHTISYIENQPQDAEQARMIAEFLVGLGNHPMAGEFLENNREKLEDVLNSQSEVNGLDILAAEALGDLNGAFEGALPGKEKETASKKLCRILRLVRRNPSHPSALLVLEWFRNKYYNHSYPERRYYDAALASCGLLNGTPNALTAVQRAVGSLFGGGYGNDTLSALWIGVFLHGKPDCLFNEIERRQFLGIDSEFLSHAVVYMGWFSPSLEINELVNNVVKNRKRTKKAVPGIFPPWKSSILSGLLDDLWLAEGTQNCKAHEAILVPVFALWAKLLNDVPGEDFKKIESIKKLDILAPGYEDVFNREEYSFNQWIELGQALLCTGNESGAAALLHRFFQLTGQQQDKRPLKYIILMGGILSYSSLAGLLLGLIKPFFMIILSIVAYVSVFSLTIHRQLDIYFRRFAGIPAGKGLIRLLEKKKKAGKNVTWWQEGANIWQFTASILLEAGREDLAQFVVPDVLSPAEFLCEVKPGRWKGKKNQEALIRLFKYHLSRKEAAHAELWTELLVGLIDRNRHYKRNNSNSDNNNEDVSIPPVGLKLVKCGQLTLEALIKISRWYIHGRMSVDSGEALRELESILAYIKDDGDFIENCKLIRQLKITGAHRLAASILQSAMVRSKGTMAETIYVISRWKELKNRVYSKEMRQNYIRMVSADYNVPSWFRLPFIFGAFRLVYRVLLLAERKDLTKVIFQVAWLQMVYTQQWLIKRIFRSQSATSVAPRVNP